MTPRRRSVQSASPPLSCIHSLGEGPRPTQWSDHTPRRRRRLEAPKAPRPFDSAPPLQRDAHGSRPAGAPGPLSRRLNRTACLSTARGRPRGEPEPKIHWHSPGCAVPAPAPLSLMTFSMKRSSLNPPPPPSSARAPTRCRRRRSGPRRSPRSPAPFRPIARQLESGSRAGPKAARSPSRSEFPRSQQPAGPSIRGEKTAKGIQPPRARRPPAQPPQPHVGGDPLKEPKHLVSHPRAVTHHATRASLPNRHRRRDPPPGA